MKKKRILISAYTACPDRGSEPGNGWNWITEYSLNGFEVDVITSGKYKKEIEDFAYLDKSISFNFIDSKAGLFLLRIPFLGIYLHYYSWLLRSRRFIQQVIGEKVKQYSFCHHVTYSSIKFGTPLFNLPIPFYLGPIGGAESMHKSLRKYLGANWVGEFIKDCLSDILVFFNGSIKKSIESATQIFISNSHTKTFIDKYPHKSLSFMFDAGLSRYFDVEYQKRDFSGEIKLLWVGRIIPRKGLNLAIRAFYELLKKTDLNVKFYVIGNGQERVSCEKLVTDLNIKDSVEFLGALPHNEVINYYKNSHIFLFPSLKDSCPMQVFEAMACGLPVVTLNHQGMKDQVIPGTGLKVDVNDGGDYPKMLSEYVLQLLNDQLLYQSYSEKAYEFGKQQIWSERIKVFITQFKLKEYEG